MPIAGVANNTDQRMDIYREFHDLSGDIPCTYMHVLLIGKHGQAFTRLLNCQFSSFPPWLLEWEFLIAPFPDHCLLVPFHPCKVKTELSETQFTPPMHQIHHQVHLIHISNKDGEKILFEDEKLSESD